MPPKKIPSRRDVRIGRGTTVANPIPEKLRKPGLRDEIEHELRYRVNRQNLNKNLLRLSPLTVSHETYFDSPDGKITIKDDKTPRHTGRLTPIQVDKHNPPSFAAYRGKKIVPEVRPTSPLTYPGNYPGIKGTGDKVRKEGEKLFAKQLARRSQHPYIGGRKTRRKKKRTRTRKRKRTRKKKNKKRRRTKKKRRRRR